jgi:putative flippase GtrA
MRPADPRIPIGHEEIAAARLPEQFLRFAAVGAVTTAVQYAVLWLGVTTFAAPAALASAAGYALGVVLSYFLNYLVTFRSSRSHVAAAPRYVAVFGIGWCINIGLMALFVHQWGWNIWLAQVLATGLGLIWNFSGSRWWTFRQSSR